MMMRSNLRWLDSAQLVSGGGHALPNKEVGGAECCKKIPPVACKMARGCIDTDSTVASMMDMDGCMQWSI